MWNEKYSAEHYIFGTKPNDFLAQNFNVFPEGNILCLAEGEGRNAVFLAKQGYTVTAVDASLAGLDKARKLAAENNVTVEFIHDDMEKYDLGNEKWDGIVSIFFHIPGNIRRELHRKVVVGLKNGGVMLLEAYTPEQQKHGTGGPPTADSTMAADLMMTAELLTQELKGLQFSHILELEREVVEGTDHSGTAAVVQVIASK
ncbi:class I SAM-dependent methyltransferase [candidate division KSB1 bacterium]|nr:class I SAM-dependent methyltransferase [candidate division KSB1 bacterium]